MELSGQEKQIFDKVISGIDSINESYGYWIDSWIAEELTTPFGNRKHNFSRPYDPLRDLRWKFLRRPPSPYPQPNDDSDPEVKNHKSHILQAIKVLRDSQVRRLICPALISIKGDIDPIAKAIIPCLTGASALNIGDIAFTPLLISWIILIVTRAGIETVCYGFDPHSEP